jgi:hypothetical protein
VLVPVDVWVYLDARRRTATSAPVRLEVGSFGIERPVQWLAGCVVLFVVFVPAYLVARQQS